MKFHNTFFRLFLFSAAIFMLVSSQQVKAQDVNSRTINQERALKEARTPTDSVKILLDIYNLSDKINRDKIRLQIIDVTQRSDSEDIIHSVIRELSTTTDDVGELQTLLDMAQALPDSSRKESLQTVLQMEHAESEASNVEDSQIIRQIGEYARHGFNLEGDPYKEIQNIYRAMTYLGTSSQGPLYFEYIKRLEELINELPDNDHAIKNLFYTTAALFYTRKRDHKKAIYFDHQLIRQLDDMNRYYQSIGDTSHDLDYYYYLSYRRMLRNFKGLTSAEVEDYYNKCLELAARNAQVAESMGNGGLTNSYYYMSQEKYDKAIPELVKALNSDNISKYRRRELLGLLATAYRETGNSKGELEALRPYTEMLIDFRQEILDDMYKEIELRNSVSKFINEEYLQQEHQRQQNRIMRKTSLTLVYVLAVILIFLCGAYVRLRTRVKELQLKNNKLRKNIEYIFDDGVPKGTTDLRHQKNRLKG